MNETREDDADATQDDHLTETQVADDSAEEGEVPQGPDDVEDDDEDDDDGE